MKQLLKNALIFAIISLCATTGFAQNNREFIRNAIQRWGNCRNVALTKYKGDIALYGTNGYAHSGCPKSLTNAIDELHEEGEFIDDIQMTENGSWLILYGDNGFRWYNIPYSLERKIREFNDKNEVITSVTFNDAGSWIVITTNYFATSHSNVTQWLKEGNEEYGKLWAACVTDDAIVAVFEDGYRFIGNVPETLKTKLKNTSINVYRLKIAGTAWFIADQDGNYDYYM